MLHWQILKRDVTEEEQANNEKILMKRRASWLNTKTVVFKTTKKIFLGGGREFCSTAEGLDRAREGEGHCLRLLLTPSMDFICPKY